MIRSIRLSVLLLIPLFFWGGSYVAPSLLAAENLKLLAAIITVLWGMDFVFFKKLGLLTNLDSLNSRDLEILNIRLDHIRRRVWAMALLCLLCSILIWIITSINTPYDEHTIALMVGILFGICVSYIAVFPFWFNELQSFQDKLKTTEAKKTKQDSILKQFVDANNTSNGK